MSRLIRSTLRINEGREKPIDRLAKAFLILTNQLIVRDPSMYEELGESPHRLLAGLSISEIEEARSKIDVTSPAIQKGVRLHRKRRLLGSPS